MLSHEIVMPCLFLFLFPKEDAHHLFLEGGELSLDTGYGFIAI